MFGHRRSTRTSVVAAAGVAALLVLAGCGRETATAVNTSTSSSTTPEVSRSAPDASAAAGTDCTPEALQTTEAGTLTIATSDPAYEPWMVDNDPTNGQGYESAVAYAVAEQLGFGKEEVSWVRVPFEAAIAPTPKDFDFDINQFSINDERKQAVDMSTGYYDVVQAVVSTTASPIADATTLAGLKDAKLGAMLGTTSLEAIAATISPSSQPAVFDSNDAGVQALQNGTIDGLVLDLPSALYAASVQVTDGVVVGQLPATTSDTEQFGLLLDKGSSLTGCVSDAVDALRADGTLDELVGEWIANASAPKLT